MIPAVARGAFEEASQEARVLAAKAGDTVQESARATKRSYRVAMRRAEDAANDATTCIRKQPLTAVGVALGAGLALGAVAGFLAAVVASRRAERET